MAGIIKRGNMWYAQYRVNGKQERKATGIHVKEHHMTARQAQELARATAREMEATARGGTGSPLYLSSCVLVRLLKGRGAWTGVSQAALNLLRRVTEVTENSGLERANRARFPSPPPPPIRAERAPKRKKFNFVLQDWA